MNRYTKKIDDVYVVTNDDIKQNGDNYVGKAVNKLAEFENIVDEISLKQEEISKELQILRLKGDKKSYKFRNLLGHKLIYSTLITIFEEHKLLQKDIEK